MQASGFLTRGHLALRHSFPAHNARRALMQLVAVFLALRIDPKLICECIGKLAKKYRGKMPPSFVAEVARALDRQDACMIVAMGS